MRRFYRPGLLDLLGLFLIAGLCASDSPLMGDPGVGWHLKSGQLMRAEERFIYSDPFLFTSQGKSWAHNQWLADIVLSAVYDLGGWGMLAVLLSGISLVSFVFLLPLSVRNPSGPIVGLLTALFCLLNGSVQWFIRPVMFSFLLFAVVLVWIRHVLATDEKQLRLAQALCIGMLFLVWANTHPAFVLGLLALGCAGFSALVDSRHRSYRRFRLLFLAGFLGLLLTFVNPYGVALYHDMFGLVGSRFFMRLNIEWIRPDFTQMTFVSSIAFTYLIILTLVLLVGGRCLTVFEGLLLILFSYAAFSQRRYIPFYGLAAAPAFSTLLACAGAKIKASGRLPVLSHAAKSIAAREQRASRCFFSGTVLVILLLYTGATGRIPLRSKDAFSPDALYPARAASILASTADVDRGPIFHTPNWGGYLIWRLWPTWRPFIDDRNQLNGEQLYREFYTLDRLQPGWEEVLKRYQFNWALLETRSPLADALRNPGPSSFGQLSFGQWQVEYEDQESVLFKRR